MAEPLLTAAKPLPPGVILSGRHAYEAALDIVIARAERELLLFDSDLTSGGYAELRRSEILRSFLAKSRHNRFTLILHDTAFLTARCPRLMGLLKSYSHAISICQTDEQARGVKETFVIADRRHHLHRFHSDDLRFRYLLDDEAASQPLHEKFCELREMSHEAVFATTLGL